MEVGKAASSDKKEQNNRILFTKSWGDWKSPDGTVMCFTVNGWVLSNTDVEVSEGVKKFFELFSVDELKTLSTALFTGIHQCSMDEYSLGRSGFGVALGHFDVAIKSVFVTKSMFGRADKLDQADLNMIVGVRMVDCDLDLASQTSESNDCDSMDSAKYYVETLRDYFEQ